MDEPDRLINALKAVVENDPTNTSLGLHLATLLRDAERGEEARAQCEAVLRCEPGNREALKLAAALAEAAGHARQAQGHRRRPAVPRQRARDDAPAPGPPEGPPAVRSRS